MKPLETWTPKEISAATGLEHKTILARIRKYQACGMLPERIGYKYRYSYQEVLLIIRTPRDVKMDEMREESEEVRVLRLKRRLLNDGYL